LATHAANANIQARGDSLNGGRKGRKRRKSKRRKSKRRK
jgi:hypothetical protein